MRFFIHKLYRNVNGLLRKDTRPLQRFIAEVQKKSPVWNDREVAVLQAHHQLIVALKFEKEAQQFLDATGIMPLETAKKQPV